ncbi:MAG: 2-oxoacid:acceptor oxidoreductase subunit alpha [Pseudomonadota bacterium]|nr:2-oxoacid:acceptor oxidoreductase subunit alpha [Pseudomonadota bacterium]
MTTVLDTTTRQPNRPLVVRFAGDSGDGIQLAGYEFARSTAEAGADFMTFPDYPAEIRAPAGTTFGVSAFQIQFGSGEVLTPGDEADVLIAFNPAALKTNLQYLRPGGLLVVDETHFDARGLKKAGIAASPLEDGSLNRYQVVTVAITKRALEALASLDLGRKFASRARNFWALGLVYWLFGRDMAPTVALLERKFANDPEVLGANLLALKAGYAHGETVEIPRYEELARPRKKLQGAKGRIISGTQAMALGIAAIPVLSQREVIYCSYPITPASALLHTLARYSNGVSTFQAEDEIAAASAAIGASYGGALGMTASSGPGLALKTEALGLAVMAELPLVVIDVQRAGPSTGMPTKPEQSDLTMAIHGRHGEAPLPVFAPATPEDCFWIMIEAARTAIEAMTPVIVLSDAYLANAASDWTPPDVDKLADITLAPVSGPDAFQAYARDGTTLARQWVLPGTKGLAHRIGGIEKQAGSGHISYDPANHAEMVRLRAEKIARIADRRPAIELESGADDADILVIGWGSTYGAIQQAVRELNDEGKRAAHVHLRQLWPLPKGLGELLERYPRSITAEMNSGQLASILRSEFLKPVGHISNITGQPFRVRDLKSAIAARIEA